MEKHDKKKLRNDLILIGALALLVFTIALCLFLFRTKGDCVTVLLDGEEIGVYPLSEDVEIPIRTGKDGTQENLLVIKDGVAYVSRANCPDGICANHRPISHEGESIVCLPHKIVIAVESASN